MNKLPFVMNAGSGLIPQYGLNPPLRFILADEDVEYNSPPHAAG
ncbi:MAG: hypothetical protein ACUVTX_07385 [Bacteroidales bacterium]